MNANVQAGCRRMGLQQSHEFRFSVSHARLHCVSSAHQQQTIVRPAEGMGVGLVPLPDELLNRRNEIRQLTWGDVQLDTLPARIVLRAKTTKSKRADALPMHPQLADELRFWRKEIENAGKESAALQPATRVIGIVPNMKCLRADLALAGIADKDEAGRYVDFHSLRVSLSTMLAANRASPRATQALMRHTDPRLTASVYTTRRSCRWRPNW